MLVATELKSPPSIRVAEVNTTVFSVSSLSRSGPHTCSGATQSWLPPRFRSRSASQSTSESTWAAIRSAVLYSSWTQPRAWVRRGRSHRRGRPALPEPPWGTRRSARGRSHGPGRARRRGTPAGCRAGRAGSRRARRAARRRVGARRPRGRRCAAGCRAARSISGTLSSSVAAWVTRADSSCASSITTTSYSGIIGTPSIASIASREWLVTTTCDSAAFSLARSAKHSAA